MTKTSYKRTQKTLAVFLALLVFAAGVLSALFVTGYTVEFSARVLPSYEREDITQVVQKSTWSDEDYRTLYLQTGLGKSALDDLKRLYPQNYPVKLVEFQEALFYEGVREHDMASTITPHDRLVDCVLPIAPLHAGDVLVTSTCHTFGWRHGHSALVLGSEGRTLESYTVGDKSAFGEAIWFRTCTNFILLRLKEEYLKEYDPAEIAADALSRLYGIEYSLFVGFFYPKDQCANGRTPTVTHCSHLVWQAFKNFGLDVDSNGGPLVTARDIARSPCFEVVQVNGFDPVNLW